MSNLSLKNINKIYNNNVQAVFDFNLEIKDKEFIVFVGPSGCGKSTTLRMAAGLEEITSGELYIDGKYMNDVAPKNRDIAMVFQSYALYPHMTVYNNMAFALKLRKIPMPLYHEKECPELAELKLKEKAVWKQIDKLNKTFKKKQNQYDLLDERQKLYDEINEIIKEKEQYLEPVIGIDTHNINRVTKTIAKIEKEITKMNSLLTKEASKRELSDDVIKEGISQREKQLEKLNKELDYLKNNEVELTIVRHLTKREIEIEVNKTAASIDLIKYLYRKPAALSGGQRQRVTLGRAIVRKPKVFLMDEPLSNLDAKLRVQTRSEISKIHKRIGATTIYVTHDQTEAMSMADRIVIMKDGYIQQIGTPDEVYEEPNNVFVGGFIGSPAMNFLKVNYDGKYLIPINETNESLLTGSSHNDNIKIKVPEIYKKLLKEYENKNLIFGIRPEAIHLIHDEDIENDNLITLESDYIELLGHESVIYSYINGQKFVIKTNTKESMKNDNIIRVELDNNKMYFFDSDTEKRIK